MARNIMGQKQKKLNQWKYEISHEIRVPYKDTKNYIASLDRNSSSRVSVPKSLI
ncbi:MAG: hypothetical protein Q8930_15840 [Bacillota bacterium]|nr:hypothetical protein [Bacillota bacterium]